MLQFVFAVSVYCIVQQHLVNKWILFSADGLPIDLSVTLPPVNMTGVTQVFYPCLWYTNPSEDTACSATKVSFAFTVASTAMGLLLYCFTTKKTGAGAVLSLVSSFALAGVNLGLWAWTATLFTNERGGPDDFGMPGQDKRENCYGLAWTCVALCGVEMLFLCCLCGIGARKGSQEAGEMSGPIRSFSLRGKPSRSDTSDFSKVDNYPPPPPPY